MRSCARRRVCSGVNDISFMRKASLGILNKRTKGDDIMKKPRQIGQLIRLRRRQEHSSYGLYELL